METFEPVREDLTRITQYQVLGKLPDPFVMDDGRRIQSPDEWPARRREIYKTAVELQYGSQPPKPEFLEVEQLMRTPVYNSFRVTTGTRAAPVTFRVQVILPEKIEGKAPVIVDGDQCWRYHMDKEYLHLALDRGVAWVFFDRTELAHDIRGEGRRQGQLYRTYPDYSFGALGAWAWGYSRCVDALETLEMPLDMDWIAFCGHSRGAKATALAGALDERARIVNPNATCAGACGCYRIHMAATYDGSETEKKSETLDDLMGRFSFWMGEGMEEYRTREEDLPFDTHFLKAMIAPRTFFDSEAAGDIWGNPVGSWQTTMAAKEVFRFLGAEDNLFWYFRPGFHEHSRSDVAMLVNVILHQRNGEPLSDRFFRTPFRKPPLAFDWRCPER
ncbi:MAG: hypothetical protein II776_01485 [Clostridia bacterium]|nr:hypothetical protein [Clostridia bacterium]